MAPESPKHRVKIEFDPWSGLLGILAILMIVLWFWSDDFARILGEATRAFIEAKEAKP